MKALKDNQVFGCLIQSLIVVLGIIFIFIVFLFIFAGDHRAALIAEIIIVLCGFTACFLLSSYFDETWYTWSLALSLPMIIFGLLFALGLIGGKNVTDDIIILASSGFFVLISSSLGGYMGTRKRKFRDDM